MTTRNEALKVHRMEALKAPCTFCMKSSTLRFFHSKHTGQRVDVLLKFKSEWSLDFFPKWIKNYTVLCVECGPKFKPNRMGPKVMGAINHLKTLAFIAKSCGNENLHKQIYRESYFPCMESWYLPVFNNDPPKFIEMVAEHVLRYSSEVDVLFKEKGQVKLDQLEAAEKEAQGE